jgi:methylmalonyl-CoA mutase
LIDEAIIARVVDPGGGSWYIESLTDDFARAAWAWFQKIEAASASGAGAAEDLIAQQVGHTRDARSTNVARRRQLITGVTEFPDIDENRVTRRRSSATTVDRYAAPFEALRDRSDVAAETGARPTIFLANIGPIAVHSARSAFAKTFFEIAGIAPQSSDPLDDDAAAGSAFAASGAIAAVICSSDKVYQSQAEAVAKALRRAGASPIYLAGNPGDDRDRYVAAGIDEFIYVGCDALDVLGRALDHLGVQ